MYNEIFHHLNSVILSFVGIAILVWIFKSKKPVNKTRFISNKISNGDIVGGRVFINGVEVQANDIELTNMELRVDGETLTKFKNIDNDNYITIVFNKGNVSSIKTDMNIHVDGGVVGDINAGKNITCKDVVGDVNANGNISCGNIIGNIKTGRDLIRK